MLIGVPREIKVHEYRVGMTPASVREALAHGHAVWVERAAGAGEEQFVAGAKLFVGGGRRQGVVVVALEVEHLAVERDRAVGG